MAKTGPNTETFDPFKKSGVTLSALVSPPPPAITAPTSKVVTQERGTSREVKSPSPAPPREVPEKTQKKPVEKKKDEQPLPQPIDDGALSLPLEAVKRFKCSRTEATQYDQAASRLRTKLGVRVDFSLLTRVLWNIYLKHEEDVLRNASMDNGSQRPANADGIGLAAFEDQVTAAVNEGLMLAARRPVNVRAIRDNEM